MGPLVLKELDCQKDEVDPVAGNETLPFSGSQSQLFLIAQTVPPALVGAYHIEPLSSR